MSVVFFNEGIYFKLSGKRKISNWIYKVVSIEASKIENLTYIFCTDSFLLDLNIRYLKHHTLTDIITFDYSESAKSINGEIYISVERVRENADKFKRPFAEELNRVLIHGVLHLLGYKDKTARDRALMRKREEACLSLF